MRDGITQQHRRRKDFVLDLSALEDRAILSPREVEKMMNTEFPIYDAGGHGRRVGAMSVSEFLRKFG
jgi:hypothetical protein